MLWRGNTPRVISRRRWLKIWLKWGIFNDTVKGSNIPLFQYPKDIDIHYPPGVSSVAHAASILSFSTNSRGFVVNGTPILRSAAAQPTVTWFVVSSPSIAIDYTRPNVVYSISESSWNEVSVSVAWKFRQGEKR